MGTVTIITGEVDEGKTAKLISLFNEHPAGTADGFASVKFFADAGSGFRGYRLRRLATNQEKPLHSAERSVQRGIPAMLRLRPVCLFPNGHRYGRENHPRCPVKPEHPGNLHG